MSGMISYTAMTITVFRRFALIHLKLEKIKALKKKSPE